MKFLYTTLTCVLLATISITTHAQCWQSIDAGLDEFAVGIKEDSTLWTWGKNDYGQLGDGTNTGKTAPVLIGPDHDWKYVSSGSRHCLAIKYDGTLWGWGWNQYFQLGDATNTDKNQPNQIGAANDWKQVSAGILHSLAIKQDGSLWAWGANYTGEVGDGTNITKTTPIQIGTDTNWQSICAGGRHSLAVRSDGTLWAWGWNIVGQLGDGTNTDSNIPIQIGSDTNWINVGAGLDAFIGGYSLGIRKDGSIWAWGSNENGRLGDGTNTDKNIPTQIGIGNSWKRIGTGESHAFAIQQDGTLWGWGWGGWGQIGDGSNTNKNTPTQIGTDSTWKSAEGGGRYTVACQMDNSLWAWGYNGYGQHGDSTLVDKNIPTFISNANIGSCGVCPLNYTANWSPFTDPLVESQTWITTSGPVLIPSGNKVKFDADTTSYVSMNPGFQAEYGSVFVAQAFNGCSAGAPQVPQGKATKLENLSVSDKMVLYPNPTTGMIHIKHGEKLAVIQVFDMVGKLLITQCEGGPETHIDLSHLPKGIYHVKAPGYGSIKVIKKD